MSTLLKMLIGLGVALTLAAFVAGSLMVASEESQPRERIILEDSPLPAGDTGSDAPVREPAGDGGNDDAEQDSDIGSGRSDGTDDDDDFMDDDGPDDDGPDDDGPDDDGPDDDTGDDDD